jgi:hypothetical protein
MHPSAFIFEKSYVSAPEHIVMTAKPMLPSGADVLF